MEVKHVLGLALVHVAPRTDFVELAMLGAAQVVNPASDLVELLSTRLLLPLSESSEEELSEFR